MGKGRTGLYAVKADALTRTHKACPKCGPGIFLAEHSNRRSCGRCGYSETKSAAPSPPVEKPKAARGGKSAPAAPPAPAAPKPA